MSFISEHLRGVSFRSFYESYGWHFSGSRDQQKIRCPLHGENEPSLSVDLRTSLYNCFACGAKGDAVTFLVEQHRMTQHEAITELKKHFGLRDGEPRTTPVVAPVDPPSTPATFDPAESDRWHQQLLNEPERMRWMLNRRGIESDTIKRYKIGWNEERCRYSFPVYDAAGALIAIKMYKPDHGGAPDKFIHSAAGQSLGIYPIEVLATANLVWIVEGELDCLLALQRGLPAVTSTGGAKSWKKEWTPLFAGKSVVVCYDNDSAGEEGSDRVAEALHGTAREVRIVKVPVAKKGGDITDFFLEDRGDVARLQELVASTPPIVQSEAPPDKGPPRVVNTAELRIRIKAFQSAKLSLSELAKMVSDVIFAHLASCGTFYVDEIQATSMGAQVGTIYYFNERTKELVTIDTPEFDAILYQDTHINPGLTLFEQVRSDLHMRAILGAKRARIYQHSHYSEDLKTLYVYRGDNRVYVMNGDEIRLEDNGVDGVIFRRSPRANVWQADLQLGDTEPLLEMFREMNMEEGELSAEEQRLLLTVFVVGMAFPELLKTRLIPVLIGQQGSGKSFTARRIGQMWCGPDWEVATVEGEKEDDFKRLLTQEVVICADNLDNRVPWMHDALAQIATGAEVQRRALYTNSQVWRARIIAFLLVTTREPRWIKREDVVQRCLPIRVSKREDRFLSEVALQRLERAARPKRMGHLLKVANRVVAQLKAGAEPQETSLRIADFAFLGHLIAVAMNRGEQFDAAIRKLPLEQRRFLAEDHPVLETLEEWLQRGNRGKRVELGVLYRELAEIGGWSERHGIRSAKQLFARLEDLKDEIERLAGAFERVRDYATRKWTYRWVTDGETPDVVRKGEDGEIPF